VAFRASDASTDALGASSALKPAAMDTSGASDASVTFRASDAFTARTGFTDSDASNRRQVRAETPLSFSASGSVFIFLGAANVSVHFFSEGCKTQIFVGQPTFCDASATSALYRPLLNALPA